MKLRERLARIFAFLSYSTKWRCNGCGKENFNGKFFCDDCESRLPYNDGAICEHCGRALKTSAKYCSTCKARLVSSDKARSIFIYDKPISTLVKKAKYDNAKYAFDYFAEKLAYICLKEFGNTEVITFVPMTEKRRRSRGYNQSEILARKTAKICGINFCDCLVKTKETLRQAQLGKEKRLNNLKGTFKVKDKNLVKGKNVTVVDDVSTTGATGEVIAETLKKAGALRVFLLTVASVPPKDGY